MTYEEFEYRYEYNPNKVFKSGGMANVYKAFDREDQRFVAIKRAEVDRSDNKYSIFKEFSLAKSLRHDYLADYYDVHRLATTMGTFDFGVMEFIKDGYNLDDYITQEKPSAKELNIFLKSLLEGMQYLHKKEIVHRDLKPSNILVKVENEKAVPKIIDFGISKDLQNSAAQSTNALGTPEYMSPEQINGNVNFKSDLWSFGVIVYKVFTGGRLPFGTTVDSKNTQQEIISRILDENITPYPEVSAPYDEIIRRCLVKNQRDRVESIDELIKIINDHESKSKKAKPSYSRSNLGVAISPTINLPTSSSLKGAKKKKKPESKQPKKKEKRFNIGNAITWLITAGICFFIFYKIGTLLYYDAEFQYKLENYELSAELGSQKAQYQLGVFYLKGEGGFLEEPSTARYWFQKAAEQKYAPAQHYLGDLYEKGIGGAVDLNQSTIFYRRAAEAGISAAQNKLGRIYSGERNYEAAFYWYQKAARNGDVQGMYNLATCYEQRRGTTQNYEVALKWYEKAYFEGIEGVYIEDDIKRVKKKMK